VSLKCLHSATTGIETGRYSVEKTVSEMSGVFHLDNKIHEFEAIDNNEREKIKFAEIFHDSWIAGRVIKHWKYEVARAKHERQVFEC
jgi:hypothetical protein